MGYTQLFSAELAMVLRGKSPAWGQGTEEERSVISKDRGQVPERAEGGRRAFWARSPDSNRFCRAVAAARGP